MEEGENSQPPTPEMYDQLIEYIDALRNDFLVIDGGSFEDWKTEG